MRLRTCARVGANVVTITAALFVFFVTGSAEAAAAAEAVGERSIGEGRGGGVGEKDGTRTRVDEGGDTRPSVALIVDVSAGKEALPSHAALWQGVAHAVSAGGKERVTVLLVAGEKVSGQLILFSLCPSSS